MRKLLVVDVVALTREHLGPLTPNLNAVARDGFVAALTPVVPAVTCSVQASMLTGVVPGRHGIVGNGWYCRDLAEVMFWRQSNALVGAPKVWELLRRDRPELTVAQMFWWFNMYSTATWSVTPRPHYTCDGRKFPGIYTQPPELERALEHELGVFPLFRFWGPEAGIESTRWIVDASLRVLERNEPDLALTYLPHLDYDFQRFGPRSEAARRAVAALDREAGRLIECAREHGYEILIVSEYAMTDVTAPVMINRRLREAGLVRVRESLGAEHLDCGASRAFAVADHQVAHVYVKDASDRAAVGEILRALDGVGEVLDAEGKRRHGLDHERSGDLVALSRPDRWFAYPWWFSDDRAPDFARTVDIHRKPGYDPVELFYDPAKRLPRLRGALKLLGRALGFRATLDLIGLDPAPVRASHGLVLAGGPHLPVLVGSNKAFGRDSFAATDVAGLIGAVLASH
jgi:predicted AlkP superfamily pyrophosphatase or phosphodiesterase